MINTSKQKNKKVFYLAAITFLLGLFTLPLTTLAQDGGSITGSINSFYNTAIALGGMAAVGVIVVGAIMYATSGAIDKKNLGKEMITSAIWGLVLLLGAFIVLNTINPELVKLKAPKGPEITIDPYQSFSCDIYTNIKECEKGKTPEVDEEGNPFCCIPNYSSSCPRDLIEKCPNMVENTNFEVVRWSSVGDAIWEKNSWGALWDAIKGGTKIQVTNGTKYQWLYYFLDKDGIPMGYKCVIYAYYDSEGNRGEGRFPPKEAKDKNISVRQCNY